MYKPIADMLITCDGSGGGGLQALEVNFIPLCGEGERGREGRTEIGERD